MLFYSFDYYCCCYRCCCCCCCCCCHLIDVWLYTEHYGPCNTHVVLFVCFCCYCCCYRCCCCCCCYLTLCLVVYRPSTDLIIPVLLLFVFYCCCCCHLTLCLVLYRPSTDLIIPVLCMNCSDKRPGNQFSIALLRCWTQEYPRELAQLLGQQLLKNLSGGKKRK